MHFTTSRYERSHGKAPKGRGSWAFDIKGETVFVHGNKTLTDAKKEAAEIARAQNVTTVHILP